MVKAAYGVIAKRVDANHVLVAPVAGSDELTIDLGTKLEDTSFKMNDIVAYNPATGRVVVDREVGIDPFI